MSHQSRSHLKQLFAEAVACPPHERARFLAESCHDPAIRDEVESLLSAHDRAGGFLEQPAGLSSAAPLALQFASPVPHLESGRRLGPYEIVARIGAGGRGEVYRARDTRLDRIVALKVLPRLAAQNAEARRLFEQEARAISRLNHPHICALYDIGRCDDIDFLVMEYLEGDTLSQRLKTGPVSPEQLFRYAGEIVDALDRAHRHGVIHRDRRNYAPAYAGLADTYALLGSMPYAVIPPIEASTKAKAAATTALRIDPTLADAHVSLAFVTYSFDWDWRGGEQVFKRAIALDPDYATAHYWYALYLGQLGRLREELIEAQRALDLEPLSLVGTYAVGLAHYHARRYGPAREFAQRTLEMAPTFPPAAV